MKEATLPEGHPRRMRVLITGGSRGIGRATVLECARRGADVLLTYRSDRAMAERTAREAEAAGVTAMVHQLDIGDLASIRAFEAGLNDGPVDAVVLNAGVWAGGRVGTIDDTTWWNIVETNLHGTYQVAKIALGVLRNSSAASITMVSSVVGVNGFPGDTAYASAKGAIISFAKSLAKEVADDEIRVNVVAPGFIATDMTAELSTNARSRVMGQIPLDRPGRPEEIAKGIAFLVFDDSYMTASVLTIDGGWSS